jgi:peroxiredoxin
MSFCRPAIVALSLVGVTGAAIAAPQQAATVDVSRLGPQVGDAVPPFTLQDQNGRSRSLQSLMGPQGLVLLFYRSADWCPYCKAQLVDQQTAYAQVQRDGYGLAAVSYDPVPILAEFSARRGITYPLLSDPGSKTIRAYGILNTTVPETNTLSYGIPFPGTFVLDTKGIVTARFFEDAYQERVSLASILVRLGESAGTPAQSISASHAAITAYLTNDSASPGTHFAAVINVEPETRVHLYAPGVKDYKPISLTIEPEPGLVIAGTTYPASEDYYFEPLNEHVPVYQHPFRIVQELSIDPSPAGTAALKGMSSLRVHGTLEYQACDDKMCFIPQSIPLTWEVRLLELDRIRAKAPR